MCKIGDIIIIDHFKNETGKDVTRHPFVVLSTKNGMIESVSFDMLCILMSSFKSENHKKSALSYDVNFEVKKEEGVKKDSFLKGNQLYCFQRDRTDFVKVGSLDIDVFLEIREEIKLLAKERKAQFILTNLNKKEESKDYELEKDMCM